MIQMRLIKWLRQLFCSHDWKTLYRQGIWIDCIKCYSKEYNGVECVRCGKRML